MPMMNFNSTLVLLEPEPKGAPDPEIKKFQFYFSSIGTLISYAPA